MFRTLYANNSHVDRYSPLTQKLVHYQFKELFNKDSFMIKAKGQHLLVLQQVHKQREQPC